MSDLQRGPVRFDGAWMRVTRSRKGGHQCCAAAQRSSVSGGPVDDEVEAAAVVGWLGRLLRLCGRATAAARPDLRLRRPLVPDGLKPARRL